MSYVMIKVHCPHCSSSKVVKNGRKSTGKQSFLCRDCSKQFQHEYINNGADPKFKKLMYRALTHGSGIRDVAAVFSTLRQTVLHLIKQTATYLSIPPKQKSYECIQIDEIYTFVKSKQKKVWVFYAYAPDTKEILAFAMAKRSAKQLQNLMLKIKHLNIEIEAFYTDAFKGFEIVLEGYQHIIGKQYTKAIEGRNTFIRARLARFQRRSTKFSKRLQYQWWMFSILVYELNLKALRASSYI